MPREGLAAPWQPESARGLGWLIALADLYYLAFGLVTAPFWCFKLLTSSRYREGFARRFGFGHRAADGVDRRNEPKAVWIHGVSVGEVLAARDLIKRLKADQPDRPIVLTVTTRTGYAIAKQNYPDIPVTYFPMDLGFAVRRTIRRLNPSVLILVELELWPNVLLQCHRWGIPVAVVNGRITQRSFNGYRLIRWALAPALARLASVCVQTGIYGERLMALGVPRERVRITGNMKFDAVDPSAAIERVAEMRRRMGLKEGQPVWVAGSAHPGEMPVLLEAWQALKGRLPALKWIVVPRHPEKRDEIAQAMTAAGATPQRLTELDAGRKQETLDGNVIMGDTMGELMAMYAAATAATLGGTWVPIGGHNPLEPAAVGVPQVTGPHRFTIKDQAKNLAATGGLQFADDGAALAAALEPWLADPSKARADGAKAKAAVEAERGSTERTHAALKARLPQIL
ncbi:MAG: 3-deoxy-D-manno-octulosonic acid transferase [Planctomycetota bacterium]